MMRVEITFTDPRQVAAFKRGLTWDTLHFAPLVLRVAIPAPFDDVAGVRDALVRVRGPLSWRVLADEPRRWPPRRPTRSTRKRKP